jgi:hypothetical protein
LFHDTRHGEMNDWRIDTCTPQHDNARAPRRAAPGGFLS